MIGLRRALSRLLLRLIGPELNAEIDRRAEIIATHRAGIALSLAAGQIQQVLDFASAHMQQAVTLLGNQDAETLRLVTDAFAQRDELLNSISVALELRADALPGEAPLRRSCGHVRCRDRCIAPTRCFIGERETQAAH